MQSKIKGLANAPHQTIKLTVTREKQNTVRKLDILNVPYYRIVPSKLCASVFCDKSAWYN